MKQKLIKFLLPLAFLFACLGLAACNKTPDKLSAPQNLKIEDKVLTWDQVEYADGYYVYVDEEEYTAAESRFDLSELNETFTYEIMIRAYRNDGVLSGYADISYIGKYAPQGDFVVGSDMEFVSLRYGKEWRITKFTVDADGLCRIPATYQNKPVTYLGAEEADCTSVRVRTLYLPCDVDSRLIQGFNFCCFPNLENIILEEGNDRFVSEDGCIVDRESNTLVAGCVNGRIPDSVTKIGDWAFGFKMIKSIALPENVVSIGEYAFSRCPVLESVAFSESITEIGDRAFIRCPSLKNVEFPQRMQVDEMRRTFSACASLTEVSIPDGVIKLNETFTECTALKKVTIPESVQALATTFKNCTALEAFTVPDTVQRLLLTFEGCTALKEVYLPSTLTTLGGFTFHNCTALESIVIPDSVTTIEKECFAGCRALKKVALPSSITALEIGVFENCSSLKSVVLPEKLTRIRSSLFMGCTALENVVVSGSGIVIEAKAFENCKSIKAIKIDVDDILINSGVFGNSSIGSLILPGRIKVNSNAFLSCQIDEVYYAGTQAEWNEKAEVKVGGNETFLAATRYYYSETEPEEAGNFWHYVDGVPAKW